MAIKNLIKLFLCVGLLSFIETSNTESPSYVAGVVETKSIIYGDPKAIRKQNLDSYKDLMQLYMPRDGSVDILVFPESTLNTQATPIEVPDANKVILCNREDGNSDILSQLSCLANDYKSYMVFNLIENENCTVESQKKKNDPRPCGSDGVNHYSTNVVFDRNGSLISKYRKYNIYDLVLNITNEPQYETFKTDFGVEFASIVSFDAFWWTPTMALVKKGIQNFVVPMWWYSELPFFTANQIYQSLSYGMNVNLLTSAGNYAPDGATGIAIYSGRNGPIVARMTSIPTQEILITEVPKNPFYEPKTSVANDQVSSRYPAVPERLYKLKLDRDSTVNKYANILLKPDDLNVTEKVCHGDFCCNFKIVRKSFGDIQVKRRYSYRLVAYSGVRSFSLSPQKMWMKTCAIIACKNDKSIKSCAKIFDDTTEYWNSHYFEKIKIQANFNKQKKMLIMPNSVDAMFRPITVNRFKLKKKLIDNGVNKTIDAVLKLKRPVSDLLTFGILTHYFDGFNYAT